MCQPVGRASGARGGRGSGRPLPPTGSHSRAAPLSGGRDIVSPATRNDVVAPPFGSVRTEGNAGHVGLYAAGAAADSRCRLPKRRGSPWTSGRGIADGVFAPSSPVQYWQWSSKEREMTLIPLVDESRLVDLINDPAHYHPAMGRPLGVRRSVAAAAIDTYFPEDGELPPTQALARCISVPGRSRVPRHRAHPRGRAMATGTAGGVATAPTSASASPSGIGLAARHAEIDAPAARRSRTAPPCTRTYTIPSIAAELGCTERTVYRYLAKCSGLTEEEHHHGQDHRRDPAPTTAANARRTGPRARVRRAADRLQEQFNLSPDAAEAFASAVVDPAEIRKAADNPEAAVCPRRHALRPSDAGMDATSNARSPQPAGGAGSSSSRRRATRIDRGRPLPPDPRA